MTDAKKELPDEIPTPAAAPAAPAEGGAEMTEEQLDGLLNGDLSFQDFFNLSDEVLLAWANQGYFFYNQGKYNEAETIFKGLVTLNKSIPYYHTALGSIYEAQEKYDEAMEEFNIAIALTSGKDDVSPDICALVNRGEIRLRKGQVLEAAEDFKRAIELDDKNTEEAKAKNDKNYQPDPAAQRARALSMVTLEVLKQIEAKVKEAEGNS